MPSYVVEQEEDRSIPEDTFVRVELESVTEKSVSYTDRKTGQPASFDKLEWWVRVTDSNNVNHLGRKIKGETSTKFTSLDDERGRSARQYYEAFLGRPLEVGEAVDTDLIIGLEADVTVERVTNKSNGRVYENLLMAVPPDPNAFGGSTPPF